MNSESESSSVCLDAYHALTIKRAPCALPFFASNGEVTTANDAGLLCCSARALDFLGVPRIELDAAERTVSLDELYGNNAVTSIENELLDAGGFVHKELSPAQGVKEKRASRRRLCRYFREKCRAYWRELSSFATGKPLAMRQ